ncbi:isocitrate lyase/phosphoenolpyruvate mutase family protein, partial [Amycolatopsis vancoresmycina]
AVRAAAGAAGVPLVLNARVDVFLPPSGIPEPDRTAEAIRRGRAYREAGADCVYPIGMSAADDVGRLVEGVPGPVNGNTGPALDLDTLASLGVARVSYGPRFHRGGLAAMRGALAELRDSLR